MSDANSGSFGYAVDIVLVIDVTGSMHPVIDSVKSAALSFHDDLANVMTAKDKVIEQLRVRVVAFRDFLDNASDALEESPFYVLPDERSSFDAFVHRLEAGGGGDAPESSLEGLAVALNSDWERGLDKRRHVVVMFTDAPAHPLGRAASVPTLPPTVPSSMDGLVDIWAGGDPQGGGGGMERSAKRLLIFAPDIEPWTEISDSWPQVLHFTSKAGAGIDDYTFDEILDIIAASV